VLRAGDAWYAYGTGAAPGGRQFEVLRSDDLVHWTSLGGAVDAPARPWPRTCWAPEVAERDGVYFLYYSMGVNDVGHRLRVATAGRPEGPFADAGVVLSPEELFAIDPHPFRDEDGSWYLYYARDELEGERPGTVLAVDRLDGMLALAGAPRTLLRASGDWQRFSRDRPIYGGSYDWHTLEGPFVRRRHGRVWLLYSGGSWDSDGYGVGVAVADHPLGPFREPEPGPALLRTVPGRVLGPGHCSVVEGPDGGDWLVYHAWDLAGTRRRMCLDRIEWTPEGPRTAAPTWTPQPAPSAQP
jgi:beta-xylosidase